MLLITAGVNSDELIGLDIRGNVFTGFDTRLVLLKLRKMIFVVIFWEVDIGMFVKSCVIPVLLAVNPAGEDVVFSNDPFPECIFMS